MLRSFEQYTRIQNKCKRVNTQDMEGTVQAEYSTEVLYVCSTQKCRPVKYNAEVNTVSVQI